MAAAIVSRVTLAGPSIARGEQVPAPKAPSASLLVVNLRSTAQLEACHSLSTAAAWFESNCKALSDVKRMRVGHRFMSRVAASRVFATSAVEDKASQGNLLHSAKDQSNETPQVRKLTKLGGLCLEVL